MRPTLFCEGWNNNNKKNRAAAAESAKTLGAQWLGESQEVGRGDNTTAIKSDICRSLKCQIFRWEIKAAIWKTGLQK